MKHSNGIDRCDCNILHKEIVDRVQGLMPDREDINGLAGLFKVFGDATRMKILSALTHSEMCVCDIAALLGMTKSSISHQLRVLKQTRLVKYRREGKVVFYSLQDEHIKNIFDQALSHISEGL
ncbi:MAG: metalloregulator ArsR/SmtB family transcription factor [Oscillospiraceae bacterium]|nr:metalloregulator ArsR/SmtB family transcription factor [Oscillospiraceae bacterium]MDD4414515.1 metalloregulator ArsR/SmtB family transcription factor [Oscillospiraceae bacterium]